YARAKKGVYQLATLTKRTNEQEMPKGEVVDMRKELHAGNRTMFSLTLNHKMEQTNERQEQNVLILNQRGYSTFMQCSDCGNVTVRTNRVTFKPRWLFYICDVS